MNIKALLSLALQPLARWAHTFGPGLRRLWAHAHLSTGLKSPLHRSVVIEGVVELHGTRRITLGQRLQRPREQRLEVHRRAPAGAAPAALYSMSSGTDRARCNRHQRH